MLKKKAVEFEVNFEDGLWQAAGVHESIFTLGETLDELWANLCEAIALHFDLPQGLSKQEGERGSGSNHSLPR